jgi:hypothetical protein
MIVKKSRRRGRGRRAWWPRVVVGSFRHTALELVLNFFPSVIYHQRGVRRGRTDGMDFVCYARRACRAASDGTVLWS